MESSRVLNDECANVSMSASMSMDEYEQAPFELCVDESMNDGRRR